MSKIYCIKEKETQKVIYIGQTIQRGKSRWYDHIRQALKQERTDPLHNLLHDQGIDKFEWEVLIDDENISKEELNNLERDYIVSFNTLYPNGYNIYKQSSTINLHPVCKKVLYFNNDKQYIDTYNSIVEASIKTGVNTSNISHCCNYLQTKTSKGWFRFEGDLTPLQESYRNGTSKQIEKLDPFTLEVIKTYESCQKAEQEEQITKGYLSQVCLGRRYAAKGFLYQYSNPDLRVPYSGSSHIKSGVAQVDIKTHIVLNKFLCCEDAARILGFSQDTISRARYNHLKPSIGYLWVNATDYLELLEKGIIFEDGNTRKNY